MHVVVRPPEEGTGNNIDTLSIISPIICSLQNFLYPFNHIITNFSVLMIRIREEVTKYAKR